MKLDLLGKQWLEIVFEGRNKSYGAYELRKDNAKTSYRSLIIGAIVFSIAIATPKIIDFIGNATANDEAALDTKITTVKLPPKEKPPENLPPPPPPPPKVDQVKFVKPVVAKTEDVTEEPPKIEEIKDKNLGKEDIKGDPDAELTVEPVGNGPKDVVEDNTIYNSAGIEVKADFPGGVDAFRSFIGKNFEMPDDEDFPGGNVIVTFVVEKDGSMTDIKVLRDVGYGTGKEAIRTIKSCKVKWIPGEQNGKKARMQFSLPIKLQRAE
ncbi:energy transducer TonB [Flavobacterium sp.]|jgi:protein TonB|uniref:energy transducer TonB n=1 Tax=Flavobacterium sp. TaxID=239 RepID=UPI0037C0527C